MHQVCIDHFLLILIFWLRGLGQCSSFFCCKKRCLDTFIFYLHLNCQKAFVLIFILKNAKKKYILNQFSRFKILSRAVNMYHHPGSPEVEHCCCWTWICMGIVLSIYVQHPQKKHCWTCEHCVCWCWQVPWTLLVLKKYQHPCSPFLIHVVPAF